MIKNKINFPIDERKDIFKRLKEKGIITTTRSGQEFEKYHIGKVYRWYKFNLKVSKIKVFSSINQHPFLKELTSIMRKSILEGMKWGNGKYKHIELIIINRKVNK